MLEKNRISIINPSGNGLLASIIQSVSDPTKFGLVVLNPDGSTIGSGSGGTVTSVNVSGGTTGITTTGGPVTSSGTITLVVPSATSSASTIVARDANQNAFANNFISKGTNTVTAGTTTTLTAASTRLQNFTGSSNQTVKMPDATTLAVGAQYQINNNSTGTLTIQDNGGNAITTIVAGAAMFVMLIAASTANGSWDYHALLPANASWGTSAITLGDAQNIAFNTTTGTKIGTSTSQKIGFFNSTPIVQPTGDVATALSNLGLVGTPTVSATAITVGTTTVSGGTTTRILYDNAGTLGEYVISGSGNVAMTTSPVFTTPNIGSATGSISGNAGTATALANARAIYGNNFDGTAALTQIIASTYGGTGNGFTKFSGPTTSEKTFTLPNSDATIARTDAAQTFTGTQTFSQVLTTNNAITASGNAATVPITSKTNTVTNNSAATLTITMATASATDRQVSIVCILDASAAAQTISWVNTENSANASVPTTSAGSTTLPLTVGFMYNAATSKRRCVASS